MDELSTTTRQLPETLPDLSRFVLVGREKLNAVRAEIRAIEKVGLAKEVHEQKLHEAQEIAEAVLDAEVRIGELTARIPKATNAGANQYQAKSTALSNEQKPKSEAIQEIGLTQKQTERFEKLARHPEAVEEVKKEAREKGEVVTRSQVLRAIDANAPKPPKKQHPFIEATIRHKEFEEHKSDKFVSFEDIQRDEIDRNTLARSALIEITDCNANISALRVFHDSDIISRIPSLETPKEVANIISDIENSIRILTSIINELKGG